MTFLDCGCCINDDGTRTWCPTCLNGPISPKHSPELLNVLNDVAQERLRQDEKWGVQNHEAARYMMILGEEYGEACEAGCRLTFPEGPRHAARARADLRTELIQVAAVAVAMIESLDRSTARGSMMMICPNHLTCKNNDDGVGEHCGRHSEEASCAYGSGGCPPCVPVLRNGGAA